MTVIAIHQPNFLPWLGFFHKIASSDAFVLLDSVQLPKTGGSWVQRVKMMISGEARWMTVPLCRPEHGALRIDEVLCADHLPWRKKMIAAIEQNYRRAPHFESTRALLLDIFALYAPRLADFNIRAIEAVWNHLGMPARRMVRSSSCAAAGSSNDLLVSLVRELGGTHYLCGGGAAGYQDDAVFSAAGLRVVHQSFKHPLYEQRGVAEFVPGLSILDALFHCGATETRAMLLNHPSVASPADQPTLSNHV